MGFEPTTASLEGWNSTTELRPPFLYFFTFFLHSSIQDQNNFGVYLICPLNKFAIPTQAHT